jgi:hypothetical protein
MRPDDFPHESAAPSLSRILPSPVAGGAGPMPATNPSLERHFSVDELAALWNMSVDFIRRLFLHEPGVVVFHHHRPGRRVYRTLRIPESVALRVHQRMRKL